MMSAKKTPFQTENESWKPSFFQGASCSFSGEYPVAGDFPISFPSIFSSSQLNLPSCKSNTPLKPTVLPWLCCQGVRWQWWKRFSPLKDPKKESRPWLLLLLFWGGYPGYPKCSRRFFRDVQELYILRFWTNTDRNHTYILWLAQVHELCTKS